MGYCFLCLCPLDFQPAAGFPSLGCFPVAVAPWFCAASLAPTTTRSVPGLRRFSVNAWEGVSMLSDV
ncbi:hypothetical protein MA16_Dca023529 [Dendrobium catenatum]|uniref:Uncharacterized protein n=1 Tax=Dendrobium catenatum TaxID=906689 RepID=A0A2I0XIN2_9ASPA|nr:hypothetical protein MA16_Dca023529 [Dendrobium catenatum]